MCIRPPIAWTSTAAEKLVNDLSVKVCILRLAMYLQTAPNCTLSDEQAWTIVGREIEIMRRSFLLAMFSGSPSSFVGMVGPAAVSADDVKASIAERHSQIGRAHV